MQIRSFRGSGEPAWVNAHKSACERLGPDPRRALGPAAIPAASTGRTRDRTRPMLQKRQKVLARAPSTRDPTWQATKLISPTGEAWICGDVLGPNSLAPSGLPAGNPIRAEHYGQRPHPPHQQAGHLISHRTNAAETSESPSKGAVPHVTQTDMALAPL
jgi:hypothetical protein